MTDRLEIRYIPLSKAREWDWKSNPKLHDTGGICQAIADYGFIDPPKFDATLEGGALLYGNGRTEALTWMKREGWALPRGILKDDATGEWLMPIVFGVDAVSQAAAQAAAIDHNSLMLSGGNFDHLDISRLYDPEKYLAALGQQLALGEMPITVDVADMDAIQNMYLIRTEGLDGVGEGNGYEGDDKDEDDDDVVDDDVEAPDRKASKSADREGWPAIRGSVRPDLYEVYLELTADFGESDEDRLEGLFKRYQAHGAEVD